MVKKIRGMKQYLKEKFKWYYSNSLLEMMMKLDVLEYREYKHGIKNEIVFNF